MLSISRIFPAYTAIQATLVPSSDQFSDVYKRQPFNRSNPNNSNLKQDNFLLK